LALLCCSCGRAPASAAEPAEDEESAKPVDLVLPTARETVTDARVYLGVREFQEAIREANPGYTERSVLATDAAKRVIQADLSGCGIKRLEPFADLALEVLDLSDNQIEDLLPLAGMPLQELLLDHDPVADLSPLAGTKLDKLSLVGTDVVDLRPLMKTQISRLDLRDTNVVDLTPLSVVPLVELRLDGTKVQDLSPLANCPLRRLTLANTPVRDLSPLAGKSLRVLDVSGTGVTDLTPITDCQLHRLVFTRRRIRAGLKKVRAMRSLRELGESSAACRAAPEYWKDVDAE
jgi:Leucine-rich repeat (LRR) protein